MADEKLDIDARYAALSERVTATVSSFASFRTEVQSALTGIQTSVNALAQELRSTQRTPWATIIGLIMAGLTAISMVGWLAYWPIQGAVVDLKNTDLHTAEILAALPSKFLSLDEFDRRLARASEDRQRIEGIIATFPQVYVPRNEIDLTRKEIDGLSRRLEYLEHGGKNGGL